MTADPQIYDSDRLARCYALTRPPVHEAICARLFAALPQGYQVRYALDVGCGAGASTAALVAHAGRVMGIDPYLRMTRQARSRVPTATFLQATADALPAEAASIDLVTAAGSLNYTDVDRALAEVARVLSPAGHLAVYDFSTGRVQDALSESRFLAFEQRFPWPPGYSLDLARLPYDAHGLILVLYETFTIEIRMSADEYVEYIMGETNIEAAVSSGASELDTHQECRALFEPLFARGSRTVEFSCVLALAKKDERQR